MRIARVPQIFENKIRIVNVSRSLRDNLESRGIKLVSDGHGYPAVGFEYHDGSLLKNESFIQVVDILVSEGVAFCRDIMQMFPPSYAVEELKKSGVLTQKIITCGYDGKNWIYKAS